MIVDICTLIGPPDKVEVVGTVTLGPDGVTFSGKKYIEQSLRRGISGPKGKIFFPKDGMEFMNALQYQFNGSYSFVRLRE